MSNQKKPNSQSIPKAEVRVSGEEILVEGPERDFWQAEYGIVINQFHKYYDIHVKAFGVYFGVSSLLFGFLLENPLDSNAALAVFGLTFSVVYFAVLMCELTIIEKLYRRRRQALELLTTFDIEDDIRPAGRWSCYIFMAVITIVSVTWTVVLSCFS